MLVPHSASALSPLPLHGREHVTNSVSWKAPFVPGLPVIHGSQGLSLTTLPGWSGPFCPHCPSCQRPLWWPGDKGDFQSCLKVAWSAVWMSNWQRISGSHQAMPPQLPLGRIKSQIQEPSRTVSSWKPYPWQLNQSQLISYVFRKKMLLRWCNGMCTVVTT